MKKTKAQLTVELDELRRRVLDLEALHAAEKRRLEVALEELKTAHHRIIQQERLSALGQMASGIAHNFNNALQPILGFSEVLLHYPETLDNREQTLHYLRMIRAAAQEAAQMIARLRDFYRPSDEVFTPVNLNRLAQQTIALTKPRWHDEALAHGVVVNVYTELGEIGTIYGSPSELREVLTNLIFNAVAAIPEKGTITIRTYTSGQYVVLEVEDTGRGMSKEAQQRCFEPFFSTRQAYGIGMGLSMAHGAVQRHRGRIKVESQLGMGTKFTVRLPMMSSGDAEGKARTAAAIRTRRILLVEDDGLEREVMIEHLVADGHMVETAGGGREALGKFSVGRFDLVIVDQSMPEISGDELAAAIKKMDPHQQVIMLAEPDGMIASGEQSTDVDRIVRKPVTQDSFSAILATAPNAEDGE